jgi:uncharacterized protein YecE (DUF72 family)
MVELNSSFYAIPNARQVERWCKDVPAGFIFNVKLHRLLSRHSTTVQTLPPELRKDVELKQGKIVLTPALEKAVAKRFAEEIEPFRATGHLGALLLQLSPSFSPRANSLLELEPLLDLLGKYSVAVELRNRNWAVDQQLGDTEAFFRKHNVTFVCVDAPRDSHFMILPSIDLVTNPKLVYLRLHGRNVKGYISGKTVAERFNHSYPDDELGEIAQRTANLAKQAEQVHIVFNNNAHDYAPRNASRFRDLFAEKYSLLAKELQTLRGQTDRDTKPAQETFSFVKP